MFYKVILYSMDSQSQAATQIFPALWNSSINTTNVTLEIGKFKDSFSKWKASSIQSKVTNARRQYVNW